MNWALYSRNWQFSPQWVLPLFFILLVSNKMFAQCPPTITATPSSASVCVGDSIQLACVPSTGATWQWYENGTAIPGATSPNYYGKHDGNYYVMIGGCPTPSNTVTISMKPLPVITLTSSLATINACEGQQVTLTVNAGANVTWLWLQPIIGTSTNPFITTLVNTTTFQVVGVDNTTNCANTVSLVIPVVPPLQPGSIQSNSEVCLNGIPPLITGTPATGSGGVYSYQWEISTTSAVAGFSDIAGATGLNYQPGNISVNTWFRRRVSAPPCPDIWSNTVLVQVNPAPVGNNATRNRCSGSNVNFTPTANIAGSTFTWTGAVTAGTISGVSATGSGIINDVLTLPAGSSTTGQVTYTITPTGPAPTFCVGTPFTLVVTVYPTPLVTNSPLSQDICSGATTTPVVLQSSVTNSTFTWTATATPGISGYQVTGSGNIPAMQLFSTLTTTGTVTYTVIPHGPGPLNCTGPSVSYVINVFPSPGVTNSPMQQSICSGDNTTLVTLTSNIASTSFTWTATAVPPSVTGYTTSGTGTIPVQTITNPTNTQGVVTYNIVPSGSVAGCAGIPRDYYIYVNPLPSVVATPGSQVICSGQSTNIALSSPVANTTFSWTATAPGSLIGFSNGNGNTIAQTITNTSNAPHDVTYVITPVSLGCPGPSTTVTVTVSPTPTFTTSPLNQTICSGNSINVNLTGTPSNVSFSWTASGAGVTGYSNGSGATITQTLTNNTNIPRNVVYTITASANGCNTAPANYTVTVNPLPSVTNSPLASSICAGSGFNLALSSNVLNTTYSWVANATPGISGHSNGSGLTINQTISNSTNTAGTVTYIITPTANGCAGSPTNYVLTVNPIPDLSLSLANQNICSGTSTTPVTFSSGVAGTTYSWTATPSGAGISGYTSSGTAQIPSQVINSTLNTQGNVTYTVTPAFNGCTGATASHVVVVNPLPLVTNLPMTQTICSGSATALVNLTSNVAGTTYTWTANPSGAAITGFQASGTSAIPVQTLLNSALIPGTVTYQIIPTSNFGPACQGTAANYITTVNPIPSITSSLAEAVCSAQPFNYAILSDIPGSTFTWSRAAVAGISNPAASGTSSSINEVLTNLTTSNIDVTYVLTPYGQVPTLCAGNPVNLTVTVRALPQVNAGMDLTIPFGTSTSLTGSSSGGTGALSYNWTPLSYIASGANSLAPVTTNLNANRTYTLNVSDAAGCINSDQMTVFVTGTPLAAAPTAAPSGICLGGSTTINANASGGSGTYTYSWVSLPAGFTSTASTFVVNPIVNTIYQVTVNDGYNSVTSSVAVSVNPLPVQYGLTGGGSYCIGGLGVVVGIAGSQSGVTYQLMNNGNPVGTPVLGNGAALSFGNQTLSGIYTVEATVVATGCANTMGSSVSVSINSLPVANAGIDQTIPYGTSTTLNGSVSGGFGSMVYNWTPAAFIGVGANSPAPLTTNLYSNTTFNLTVTDANNCTGSDQVTVFLSGSAINVVAVAVPDQICADTSQAQLLANTTGGSGTYSYSWSSIPAGSPVWSSTLQNPMVSPDVTTTYTVVANDGFNTATSSATIVVNPLPLQYSVTGGGSYCFAGTGVSIGLSGSQTNTNYQLYRGGVPDGPAVTGDGNPISFGLRTAAFTYTVIATNNTTGCINQMNGSATVVILPPPNAYLVTGGGSYPAGGPGRNIGLSFGDLGISYQLYCDNVLIGAPILGSNSPVDFGLQTQAGTYTVVATDLISGCTSNMNGSVNIIILPLPTVFQVLGGGEFCAGQPGLPVQLSGSEAGVNYQLLLNGFPFGPIVAGTNNPLNWGPFTTAGLYEVRGINASTAATSMMNDSAVIVVNPLPTVYTMSPVGNQCPGTIQRLNGSETGIRYYLEFNGIVVDSLDGTGIVGFLDFGPQNVSGTYTIRGVNLITGCETMMNGSTFIEVAPQIFNVIPAGILCPGQSISITGSQMGVNYQLRWNGTFDMGAPVAGTGAALVVGNVTLPGIYSVIAIDAITNCVSYMNDSATLYPDPTVFTVVPNGTACEGSSVGLNGSQSGVDYVLYLDGAIQLDTIHGTGFPINFGPQLTEGNYTVLAVDQTSYCTYNMNGTAVLFDSPVKYNLVPSGIQCIGSTLELDDSQSGIEYQLLLNGIFNIGSPVAGNGSSISFGQQNLPGTYTVRAVNVTTGCNSMMADSAILEALPVIYTVTPAGIHCAGTSIGLNGSQLNHNYVLVLNGTVYLDTIAGTGAAINFPNQALAGIYTIVGYQPTTNCASDMSGNCIIDVNPVVYNITPAGIVCPGVSIGLDNTEVGVSYQLRNGLLNVGSAVAGTGSAISFGIQTLPGTYTIVASGANSCVSFMNGNVVINPLPSVYTVTPGGSVCAGTGIGVNGSDVNVNYVLVLDGIIHIDTISGSGAALSFGPQITSGTYTVYAYNQLTGCQIDLNGNTIIDVAPVAYNITPAGIACSGDLIGLDQSEIGVTYQLRRDGTINMGPTVMGTGGAIFFGTQTLPGNYTVIATNANGCYATMNGNVALNSLPVAFNIIPSGTQCQGTELGTDGSELNVNYVLVLDGTIYVDTIPGTGAMITFGPQLTSGVYTILAFNSTTACSQMLNGSTTISNVAPAIYNMTPAGIICAGAIVGLDNSEPGALYQLRRDGSLNVGLPVLGTGSAISFGVQTLPGTYSVVATNLNGCNSTMNGNVVINALPTAFNLTPSGAQCQGTTLGIDGSEIGVNYILVLDGSINLDTLAGNGLPLSFGPQSTSGTYSVLAYYSSTLCQKVMNNTVLLNPAPLVFNITPAGIICVGASIGLDNSETGVTYQLRNGLVNVGTPIVGTGSVISFGVQNVPGTYTIVASGSNSCVSIMNGSVIVNPLPVVYTVNPIGSSCAATAIGLNGSEIGVNYVLVLDGIINLDTIPGNGASVSFGPQVTSGVYTIIAYNPLTNCNQLMNGSASIDAAPISYNITPAGIACVGDAIGLDNSEVGVTYQLQYNGTINIGMPLTGNGSALNFGVQTLTGTYTIIATNANGCVSQMNGSVVLNSMPAVYNITPVGSYCMGINVGINGSEVGVNYILVLNSAIHTDTITGTGAAISFGMQTTSGTYTVIAYNTTSDCEIAMSGSCTINSTPLVYNLIPSGILCAGQILGLDDSETGINYQLRRNGSINVGAPIAGTGAAISFGVQTLPGTYTVEAIGSNSCAAMMNGNAVINANPVVFVTGPAGNHCPGTSITLNGSEPGIQYVLMRDGAVAMDTLTGTGSTLNFGSQYISGTYSVVAYLPATPCFTQMSGNSFIVPAPEVYNVTPAGINCIGASIGLDNSQIGVTYQLRRNGTVNVGAALPGTGLALDFGVVSMVGTYTVIATNSLNGCGIEMNGSALIQPSPLAYTMQPQGNQCAGIHITLNGSQVGTSYVLVLDNTFNLDTIAGTGNAIDFGSQMITGSYTVVAIGGAATCQSNMLGTAIINAQPAIFNLTPAGLICSSANVGLDGSEVNVNYELYKNAVTTGVIVNGTGSAISFGVQTSGDYTVVAINTLTGCSITMPGSLQIGYTTVAIAGSDLTICSDQTVALSGNASYAGTTLWSTLGDGSFDDANLLNATYTPGSNDITIGSVQLILHANGTGACALSSDTDTVMVTLAPIPVANAGNDITVCQQSDYTINGASANNYSSIAWSTSGSGSIVNANTLNPTYNPSAADLASGSVILTFSATGINPCNQVVSDNLTMNFVPFLQVNAGVDGTICESSSFTVSTATAANYSAVLWSSMGSGIFTAANTLNPTYTPSSADIVSGSTMLILTATSATPCNVTLSDTIVLNYILSATANAGADGSICENTSLVISDATASNFTSIEWTTSGTGGFNNSSLINPVYTPSAADIAAGSVTLTLTAYAISPCTDRVDSRVVTIIGNPSVNAGADTRICTNPYTLTGATSMNCASVQWTVVSGSGILTGANSLLPTYLPSVADIAAGSVVLQIAGNPISPCVNGVTDVVTLFIDQTPIVNAGNDDFSCNLNNYTVNDASATHYTSLLWVSTGSGTIINPTSLNATYLPSAADLTFGSVILTLTASNVGCGSISDSKLITFVNTPSANAGSDMIICEGSNTTMGGASVTNSNFVYWTTSGTGTFTNGNTLTPTYNPSAADIATGIITLTLHAQANSPCTGEAIDNALLTIKHNPIVNAGADVTLCEYDLLTNADATASNYTSVVWTTSGTGTFDNNNALVSVYNPSSADVASGVVMLTLTASNAPCSDVSDSKVVTLNAAPIAMAGPDAIICNTCVYQVTGASAPNSSSVQWVSSGSGSFSNNTILNPVYTPSVTDYANGSVVLSMIAFGNAPCHEVSDQMTITFSNNPNVDFTWGPACENEPISFYVDPVATNIGATISYHWNFGDGTTSMLMNPVHQFAAIGQHTVTLTTLDTLGNAHVIFHEVFVSEPPIAFFAASPNTCSNAPVLLDNQSWSLYGYIAQTVWNYGDGSPNDTILWPDNPDVYHLFDTSGVFNVTVTVTNSFGCLATVTLPVEIIEAPIANFTFSNDCSGDITSFVDASAANGAGNTVSYWWDFDDPASGINNFSNAMNPDHVFSAPGSYEVKHVVTNYNNCSDTIVKEVVILQPVAVDFIYDHTCINAEANFGPNLAIMNPANITAWHWDFGDGSYSYLQNPIHIYAGAGNYQVTLTVTDNQGCTKSKVRTVVVNPLPVALFNMPQLPCANSTVAFDDLSTTYAGYIIAWNWDFGDGTSQTIYYPSNGDVEHVYAQPGNYVVTLSIQATDSCMGINQQTIVIAPAPTTNFENTTPCKNVPVQFTDLSQTGGTGVINGWSWNFGDDISGWNNYSTQQNPAHTYASAGNYTVTLTVSTANGCNSTLQRVITVGDSPFVDFTFDSQCQNANVQFTPAPGVVISDVQSWFWNFGDGLTSTQSNPQHIYTQAGNYNVSLTIVNTAGCSNTISHPISVLAEPVAAFTTNSPACSQLPVQFVNQSVAPAGYIVKWEWNFGDGQSLVVNYPANPSVTHTYSTYGSYNAVLTVTTNNGCISTISKNVQILQSPLANFDNDNTCAGGQTQFSDLSQGNIISWYWNFGDPGSAGANNSSVQNPTHQYQQPGTYQVSLMVLSINGCTANITKSVVIAPKPTVNFSYNNGCVADTVQFVSSTFVNVPNTASWFWTFGDGNTSSEINPLHIYAGTGTYNATLTITDLNGCSNTLTKQVQVSNKPTALFTTNAPACSGTPVMFNDISSTQNGTITSWHWDFGDGTTAVVNAPANPDVTHLYAMPGIYNVVLSISTSTDCEASFTSAVSILSAPVSAFSTTGNCYGQPTQFTDLSQAGGTLAIVSWYWNFGDASSGINNTSYLQNPAHLFSHAGTFTVTLITENQSGCTNTLTQTVTISEKPGVGILVSNPTCFGTPVGFSADPTMTNTSQVSTYEWDFGDGSAPSPLAAPEHLYTQAGTYIVTLTITNLNGCENSVSKEVVIHQLPVAQYNSTRNCIGNLTEFTDNSFNPDGGEIIAWMWDFGVPGITEDTSSLQNPVYGYASTGTYMVSLTVTTDAGCSHTTVNQLQVFPKPHAQFSYIPEPCHNGSAVFTDESFATQSNITGWYWEFTPGHYSTLQNPVYVFGFTDTTYNVKLIVNNQYQCTDTAFESVYIPSGLEVALNYTNTCHGETTYFSSSIIKPENDSIVWYNWNFGDPDAGINNISTLRYPEHTYSKPGTYVVSLEAIDVNNCATTTYKTVKVWPVPQPKFSYFGGVCDSTIMLHDLTTNADIKRWIWQYGDGKADTINSPQHPDVSHFYTYPGIYMVTLTTESFGGCINSITDTIRRIPCMESAFSVLDTVVCQNRTMYFSENSSSQVPIASWQWFFGDGTSATYTSDQPIVTHEYSIAGTYKVTMVIATQMVGGIVTDSSSRQVVVKPAPTAAYTFKNACLGNDVPFTNTTLNNNTALKNYTWSFGDPYSVSDTSTAKHPKYKYGVYGEYTVKLVATNTLGCSDTVSHVVGIYQHPYADFNWESNCESKPVHFSDRSDTTSSAIAKWNWYFGSNGEVLGASLLEKPSYVFGRAGIYETSLVITDKNGCTDSIQKQIAINSSPVAAFSVADNYENVQGQIQLNNGTINGTHYLWDFGNGKTSSAANPVTTFEQDGNYEITLVTWNGQKCADTLTVDYKLLFKGLFVPNAFNPGNLDPEVGIFKPKGTNLLKYHVEVLDRWGNPLWSSNKLDASGSPVEFWDGTMHGEILPEGVYVWKITAMFRDGVVWDGKNVGNNTNIPQYRTGTVTLIR